MRTIHSLVLLLILIPSFAFAQEQGVPSNPGITPGSPFFFLDTFGEALRSFFTFNPEGKARLQITFAAERVAEMEILLETKGVEAKGLEVAKERLQTHIAKAAAIVTKQKEKGKDVSSLAAELDNGLEAPKAALARAFKEQKQTLKAQKKSLKAQLKAGDGGNGIPADGIVRALSDIESQLLSLEREEDVLKDKLGQEEDRLEEQTKEQHKAEKAIGGALEEQQELMDEAAEEGVDLPWDALAEFDGLFSQAQAAFAAEDFVEARRLAKQAEDSLEAVDDLIDELEDAAEEEEEEEEGNEEDEEEDEEEDKDEDKDEDEDGGEDNEEEDVDGEGEDENEEEGNEDENDAFEAIEDAKVELEKAEEKISRAEGEEKETSAAQELLEQARKQLNGAEKRFAEGAPEEAEELAEKAKDLASEARGKGIGKTSDEFGDGEEGGNNEDEPEEEKIMLDENDAETDEEDEEEGVSPFQ